MKHTLKNLSKAIFTFLLLLSLSPPSQAASPDDIVINEFMADPSAVSDTKGEWIELYNTTDTAINLNGWTISDLGSNSHTISEDLFILPQDFLVLGRNDNTSENGGLNVDYVYSSFTLSNNSDEIILSDNLGNTIDQILYDSSWDISAGSSLELTDYNTENNNPNNWNTATTPYGDGDNGTPGTINSLTTPPTSSANLPSGTYYGTQTVTLSALDTDAYGNVNPCPECTIYYTLNGSTPTTSSPIYTSPISITSKTILKFFAVDTANNSEPFFQTKFYSIILPIVDPYNFHASLNNNSVVLNWNNVKSASGYQLYRSTNLGKNYSYLDSTTNTTYTDNTVSSGTYIYKLVMVTSTGELKSLSATSVTIPELK